MQSQGKSECQAQEEAGTGKKYRGGRSCGYRKVDKVRGFAGTRSQRATKPMVNVRILFPEIEIKTMMRCYLTLIRMAITKKTGDNKYWGGCGVKGTLVQGG